MDINTNVLQNKINDGYLSINKTINRSINIPNGSCSNINSDLKSDDNAFNKTKNSVLLQDALYSERPFNNLLPHINMDGDSNLVEIAKRGISNTINLQRTFFLEILPQVLQSQAINVENKFLSRWIKIKRQDSKAAEKLDLLTRQVATQNFDHAIQIIDSLPDPMQKLLQGWREKVMDYIYVQESLKEYLKLHA